MLLKQTLALLAIGLAPLSVSAAHFAVTGAPVDAGADVPMRLNINDFQAKGGPQWELYLRALKSLQDKDAHDPLSYFQVAGIHGLPYTEWNKGGAKKATGWAGYCPHGENIFLTWHRPFVLLYEQVVVAEAKAIANQYPEKYRAPYVAAAKTLRVPYWDWSADPNVPPATIPSTVTVNVPNGQSIKKTTINNPLQTYNYPKAALNGEFGRFPRNAKTVRCPAPQSYPASANQGLKGLGLKQSTYDAFTYSTNFNEFAVTRQDGLGLEQMHNSIHWDAGCGGQFLDASIAGFEPLFMLHHTQVDRLWTYWQFINPAQSIFTTSYRGQSRYSTPQNTIITPDSPLQPFYDSSDKYWTSKKTSNIKGMGYTYQSLEYWKKSAAQLKTDATKLMNTLYAPKSSGKRDVAPTKTRYFARVELNRTQVERPCSVNVFISGKQAGSVVVMQLPEEGILRGSVAVDDKMAEAFGKTSDSDGSMGSVEHLVEMEIRKPDGTIIALNTVPSLNLTLEQVAVTPPKSNTEFPKPGKKKNHRAGLRDRHRKKKNNDDD